MALPSVDHQRRSRWSRHIPGDGVAAHYRSGHEREHHVRVSHKTTVADAVRAYVQSMLKSKHRTFVRISKELWPSGWHTRGFKDPVCLLERALYGHPEAGAHWENHLTAIIKKLGGRAIPSHPSAFWIEGSRLILTIYVDDLMLSGPVAAHEAFWSELMKDVLIDPPEPLERFLGRNNLFSECSAPDDDIMESFKTEVKPAS